MFSMVNLRRISRCVDVRPHPVPLQCSVVECLHRMLVRWLTWHSVYAQDSQLDISVSSHTPQSMSLSGLMDSVVELVQFVGLIATVGLQMEGLHTLLLSFTLHFYQTVTAVAKAKRVSECVWVDVRVCDMYLKYDLPLVLMPPAGVFYPALLSPSPVIVDQLCRIMHRAFHPGTGLELAEDLLAQSRVPEHWGALDLIHHPAFMGHALDFHQRCWPERKELDLNSIKVGKRWDWYTEFLFSKGYQGLQEFFQSSLRRRTSTETQRH
ncbi:hypothetical protein JZ751_025472 [Albula glossodonta]|uniref:Uncharacterized protein n=1 Tax=Albula glossodonta TaxID=121402 RepID=A0A8T2NF56_9TELE|nr:hypothetical protein JZ751_025472 [Albula glossodonta]